jgi:phage portal protein BeeE
MSNVFSRLISRLRRQQLPITNYSAAGTYESPEYAPSLNIDDCGYGVDPYKQVAIIHSVISRKSNALSSANFVIQERIEGQWVTSDKHPWIIDLLENPSPYTQRYTKSDWLHLCMVHLDLLGNFVIKPIRNDEGRPIELDVIYPLHLAIEYDKIGHPLQYRHLITDDREKQTSFQRDSSFGTPISLESLIHVRYPNPDSTKFWGVAPLLALQDEVGIGKLAIHWNKNTLKDRGVTDVAFIFKDVDSESQWKLANKMVTERYANQGRKPWVLGGNAVVQPLHS